MLYAMVSALLTALSDKLSQGHGTDWQAHNNHIYHTTSHKTNHKCKL